MPKFSLELCLLQLTFRSESPCDVGSQRDGRRESASSANQPRGVDGRHSNLAHSLFSWSCTSATDHVYLFDSHNSAFIPATSLSYMICTFSGEAVVFNYIFLQIPHGDSLVDIEYRSDRQDASAEQFCIFFGKIHQYPYDLPRLYTG